MAQPHSRILRFHGLAFRYSLFFLVAIGVIFYIAFIYSYRYSQALLIEGARKDAGLLTQQTIARFENFLVPTETVPRTLAHALETPGMSYEDVFRLSSDFVRTDPVVFGSCMAFEPYTVKKDQYWFAPYVYENGENLSEKSLGSATYDYFRMDWYLAPKRLGRPVWSEPYFDKGGGDTMMCTYSTPFYKTVNGTRKFAGVLTMDVSLAAFDHMVREIKVFKSGFGFLVSRQGMIITSQKYLKVRSNVLAIARAGKGKENLSAVQAMLDGKTGFTAIDGLMSQNHPGFVSYAPVGTTGWSFGVLFPADALMDDMFTFFKKIMWIFAASILALVVATVLITRNLTRPIIRLVEATRLVGQGDFRASLPVRRSKDEIAQLTHAFAHMQVELGNYVVSLRETTTARERIESELAVAHQIQMGMLPSGFSNPAGWELCATLDPAREIGGDLYDYFYLGEDRLCLAIGDVSGKGIPAALFMMVTRTLLRAKAVAGMPVNEIMQSINRELCQDNPNQMFVTFIVAIVDLKTGVMDFCNAGHGYPYIIREEARVGLLKSQGGLPLGVSADVVYMPERYVFAASEVLVMATDGITDALNAANGFYGEPALIRKLASLANESPGQIIASIKKELKAFSAGAEQADDITMVVLQKLPQTQVHGDQERVVRMRLANTIGMLNEINATLEHLPSGWNITPKLTKEINLVLEELFSNVVLYAYDDQEIHVIAIDLELVAAGKLVITMCDDGRPFNLLEQETGALEEKPSKDREVGGLGIHFIKKFMSRVDYRREGDQNIVILTRNF